MRKYLVTYDNGNRNGDLEYFSNSRLNSRANEQDAKDTMYSKFRKTYPIVHTQRYECY